MSRLLSRSRMQGLTTIELMISITISLIILSALTYIYVGSRGAYRTSESLARVQESGRAAIDWLSRDLRGVGFIGPVSSQDLNTEVIADPPLSFTRSAMLQGYETGVTGWAYKPTSTAAYRTGDVITLLSASGGSARIVNHDFGARKFQCSGDCLRAREGDYVAVAGFQKAALFRVSNDPTAAAAAVTDFAGRPAVEIAYAQIAGRNSADLKEKFGLANTPVSAYRFREVSYYVGTNPSGVGALYRVSPGGTPEELAENVEDLEVVYGLDTTGSGGAANAFLSAGGIDGASGRVWANVVSVRVNLLVIGTDLGATSQAQTFFLRDTTGDGLPDSTTASTANASRLHQVFTTTVALRNRLP